MEEVEGYVVVRSAVVGWREDVARAVRLEDGGSGEM
jgi:hypothetical protein